MASPQAISSDYHRVVCEFGGALAEAATEDRAKSLMPSLRSSRFRRGGGHVAALVTSLLRRTVDCPAVGQTVDVP
jgi:hypothetical protein